MNSLVYHYCRFGAALRILKSNKIWFSDITKTNDPDEYRIGFNIVSKIVLESFPNVKYLLEEISPENINRKFQILNASFSEDGDCLSLWRAYGDDGMGAAICFNRDDLKNHSLFNRYIQKMAPVIGNVIFFNIIYEENEFKKEVNRYLTASSNVVGERQEILKTALMRLCYTYKSSNYRDEREVRAVAEVDDTVDSYEVKTRRGKYGETKYHELNTNFESINSLKSVVLGPKCKAVPIDLEERLKKMGLNNVQVEKSKVQYR